METNATEAEWELGSMAVHDFPNLNNTVIVYHDEDPFWQCSIEEYKEMYTAGIRFAVCEKMSEIYRLVEIYRFPDNEPGFKLMEFQWDWDSLSQLIKDYHDENKEENPKIVTTTTKEVIEMDTKPVNTTNNPIKEGPNMDVNPTTTTNPNEGTKMDNNPQPTTNKTERESNMFHGIVKRNDGWFRLITALPLLENDKVLEEFNGGPYWPVFLEQFFPDRYRIEVRKMKPSWHGRIPSQEPTALPNVTNSEVLRWSNASDQYTFRLKGVKPGRGRKNTWLAGFDELGIVIKNSKKMPKRLAEIVRMACMWTYDPNGNIKIKTIDYVNGGYLDGDVDGISAISQSFAIRCIVSNHLASREWIDKQIAAVLDGQTTVVQIRGLIKDGLIKGNALVLPDKMMEGYDIKTFDINIKPEISTKGWQFVTIEPSHSAIPVKADDLTMAIYQDVNGLYAKDDLIRGLIGTLEQAKVDLEEGKQFKFMTTLVDNNDAIAQYQYSEEDEFRRPVSTLEIAQKAVRDLDQAGIPFDATQTLRWLTVNGFKRSFLGANEQKEGIGNVWRHKQHHWFPVEWAYATHVITQEALEIFGFKNVYNDCGYYHKRTHCFAVPGKYFEKNHINHGGDDLDDTWKIHVRLVRFANAEIKLMAFILRNPNDFGEWSMIPIENYGPVFHRNTAFPPVVDYDELLMAVPQSSYLQENNLVVPGTLPGSSTLKVSPEYSLGDEARSRLVALAFPGGVGSAVLPKILWYALNNEYIKDPVASNEDIIDAIEQGLATVADAKLIAQWVDKLYRQIRETNGLNGTKMDMFWMVTRMPKVHSKDIETTTIQESPWCQLHIQRETLVRTTVAQMSNHLNTTLVEPEVLFNIEWTKQELINAARAHQKISSKRRAMTAEAWVDYLCDLFTRTDNNPEKGVEYMNRMILALAYQSYIAKRQYPNANHDQWLYTFSAKNSSQPIDWFIRALNSI